MEEVGNVVVVGDCFVVHHVLRVQREEVELVVVVVVAGGHVVGGATGRLLLLLLLLPLLTLGELQAETDVLGLPRLCPRSACTRFQRSR